MAVDIVFAPHVSNATLLALALLVFAISGAALILRARGTLWRALAMGAAILVLLNPSMVEEDRKPLPDIAFVVVDTTQSQSVGTRTAQTTAALAKLKSKIAEHKDLEVKVINVSGAKNRNGDTGTILFDALHEATADVPQDRIAGAVLITDGQVHDVPTAKGDAPAFPVHTLLTGEPGEKDRKLTVQQAPRFGIVGEKLTFSILVEDFGTSTQSLANVEIRVDGKVLQTVAVKTGVPATIQLTLPHGGENIIELFAQAGPNELSLLNNRAAVVTNGIRDQLKVLLVSGEPHAGERTLRNLLKADPSVSLVHFTILRPPEKQDGTPVDELSLIAFPTRELFDEKLNEFNLIIFDRYQRRGILQLAYYENVARYVENGGALLVTSGPEYATPYSLYRSPLASVLPAEPLEGTLEQGYKPRLTSVGKRHPVTTGLPGAETESEPPSWGRWFRLVQASVVAGQTLMNGPEGKPLLALNRVQQGRVALLLSDHAWLWTRGFEGGGPQAELLRRLAHWLMKEPDLEEERLHGQISGDRLMVTRQTMSDNAKSVEVTFPSGRKETVSLSRAEHGAFAATLKAGEMGLYRLRDGNLSAVVVAGPLNPKELSDLRATEELLKPVADATRSGINWINRDGIPDIRRTKPGRHAAGNGWIGLQANESYAVSSTRQTPIFHPALALLLIVGSLMFGWHREGR